MTFTPSGTHAVHLGLLGLAARGLRDGLPIAHTAVEHSAVLHAARWAGTALAVPVDRFGRVLADQVPTQAAVMACQAANHEVGTIQPVLAVREQTEAPLFVDACASGGRLPLPEAWDAAALSAHKWGGPAGVGVLLVRKRARWHHPFPTDDRVDERSTGFENVPAVLAAAASLQAVVAERDEVGARQHALVDVVRRRVAAEVPDVEVVGDPDDRLPHLVTFSCLYVDGEALVDRARPARLRHRQRLGLHVLDPHAEPRAGGHGRAQSRQRPPLSAA